MTTPDISESRRTTLRRALERKNETLYRRTALLRMLGSCGLSDTPGQGGHVSLPVRPDGEERYLVWPLSADSGLPVSGGWMRLIALYLTGFCWLDGAGRLLAPEFHRNMKGVIDEDLTVEPSGAVLLRDPETAFDLKREPNPTLLTAILDALRELGEPAPPMPRRFTDLELDALALLADPEIGAIVFKPTPYGDFTPLRGCVGDWGLKRTSLNKKQAMLLLGETVTGVKQINCYVPDLKTPQAAKAWADTLAALAAYRRVVAGH